jgi:hypothetical protein
MRFWTSIGSACEDERNIIRKGARFELGVSKCFYKGPQAVLWTCVAGFTCKIYNRWHTRRPKVMCQLYSSRVIYKREGGTSNKRGGPQFGLPWFGLILYVVKLLINKKSYNWIFSTAEWFFSNWQPFWKLRYFPYLPNRLYRILRPSNCFI